MAEEGPKGVFQDTKELRPCSLCACVAGHQWVPKLAVVACEGCKAPIVVQKMENCPYCNEPMVKVDLRSDFLPVNSGVPRRCQGQVGGPESTVIELRRSEWMEIESKGVEDGKEEKSGSD